MIPSRNKDEIIGRIQALLDQTSQATARFASETGLVCQEGCGQCCDNPSIETTITEVLPLAQDIWAKGQAQLMHARLKEAAHDRCILYEQDPNTPGKGRCLNYDYRPGICRLFGFSATTDKHNKRVLATCKVIKSTCASACAKAQDHLDKGLSAPKISTHTLNVANIDPQNGTTLYPINTAILQALERLAFKR